MAIYVSEVSRAIPRAESRRGGRGRPRAVRSLTLAAALAIVLLPAVGSAPAQAAPGDLDATFSGDGKLTEDFGGGGGRDVAIQDDGKLVVVGQSGLKHFALARYNANGTLDATFGTGGKVTADFGRPAGDHAARAVAIQDDGKIVVAGKWNDFFAVGRFNSNGTPDTSFAGDGMRIVTFETTPGSGVLLGGLVQDMVIQSDGKIVAGGYIDLGGGRSGTMVARFNPADGSLDGTFSGDGVTVLAFSDKSLQGHAVALSPGGRIVVAGSVTAGGGATMNHAIMRLTATGALDSTFSGDGYLSFDYSNGRDSALGVTVTSGGKPLIAGLAPGPGGADFVLTRLTAAGGFDPTFGNGGSTRTDFSGRVDFAEEVVQQPNGAIVVAGWTGAAPGQGDGINDFAVARYGASGQPDKGFGTGGKMTTNFGGADQAFGLALQSDGALLVAGTGAGDDFAVARYQGGGAAPRCTVPRLRGKTLTTAKRMLLSAHCRLGTVTRKRSTTVRKGRVISHRPTAGTRHPAGTAVAVVVSSGR